MNETVVSYYRCQAREFPDQPAFYYGPPHFDRILTWKQIWEQSAKIALRIKDNGIQPGTKVGVLSPACPHWEITQLSIFLNHCIIVGLDPHDSPSAYELIIQKTGLRVLFVNGRDLFAKISPLSEKYGITLYPMEPAGSTDGPVSAEFSDPGPDSQALILFTSGTSFEPKGIEYTHRQIHFAVESVLKGFPEIPKPCRTTCWLPLSNLFQKIINFCCVATGGQIYFVEKPQDISRYLKKTSPHVFIAVPRFYEKAHSAILSKINQSLLSRGIFLMASIPCRKRSAIKLNNREPGTLLKFLCFLADRAVFRKIRGQFGGQIAFAISGSAPIRRDVLEFFDTAGILILEAYGTSENIVPIAANRVARHKFGSVGVPLLENSVKISPDKEILVQGPGLFKGYLGVSSDTFFENGFYKTGDVGHFDQEGFLFLEGRKSEVFKTSTGKKVPAVEIDSVFQQLPYVDVALTLGENRKAPLVLITLDFSKLAQKLGMTVDGLWDIDDGNFNTQVLETISEDILRQNDRVPDKIRPAGFLIFTRKFTFENDEVTANLKIRRRHIEKKLTPTLDKIYLKIDAGAKTGFWFLNSQDIETSAPAENKIISSPPARFWGLVLLFGDVVGTILSYRFLSKPDHYVYRKLGQILRVRLGRLRGPLQKLGQMLSCVSEDLPHEFRDEMRDLLRDSPSVNPFLIRSIVESELKKPIASVFSEWRDAPLYTASIGQVHFARLHSGEAVAVKVLLPNMDRIARSDLFLLNLCLPLLTVILRSPSVFEHFRELKGLLIRETDFRYEAEYIELFAKLFRDHPRILIPEIKKDLCTSKVLVMDYIEGLNIERFVTQSDENERKRVAETIWEFHCLAINRFAMFNADPHPGNYIITGDKVAFIDFGFCKTWDLDFIELWKKQTLTGCGNDEKGFIEATRRMGFAKKNDPEFFKKLLPVYREVFLRPWIEDKPFKISAEYLKLHLQSMYSKIIAGGDVRVPEKFLAASRLYWGLFALMAEFNVELNYYRLMIPFLEEPTFGHDVSKAPQHLKKIFLTLEESLSRQTLIRRPEPSLVMSDPQGVKDFDQSSNFELGILHALGLEVLHRSLPQMNNGLFLDLGCGSGQLTSLMARLNGCGQITALDLSEAMLQKARDNAAAKHLSDKMTFRLQDVSRLDNFADNQNDVSTFCFIAHHLPDLAAVGHVLEEMDRITKPEGIVFIMDLVRFKTDRTMRLYIDLFGRNYRKAGLVHMFIDAKNSVHASWTTNEMRSVVPADSKRSWFQLATPGIPVVQFLLGVPKDRKKVFLREGLPWDQTWDPVPPRLRLDWHQARALLFHMTRPRRIR